MPCFASKNKILDVAQWSSFFYHTKALPSCQARSWSTNPVKAYLNLKSYLDSVCPLQQWYYSKINSWRIKENPFKMNIINLFILIKIVNPYSLWMLPITYLDEFRWMSKYVLRKTKLSVTLVVLFLGESSCLSIIRQLESMDNF